MWLQLIAISVGVVSVAVGIGIPVFYETQIDNAVCRTHIASFLWCGSLRKMEVEADIYVFRLFPLRYRRNGRIRSLASLVTDRALVSFALENWKIVFFFLFALSIYIYLHSNGKLDPVFYGVYVKHKVIGCSTCVCVCVCFFSTEADQNGKLIFNYSMWNTCVDTSIVVVRMDVSFILLWVRPWMAHG